MPTRVVSLLPAATEIVGALGMLDRLAGNAPAAEPASEPQGDRNPYWRNEFTPHRRPVSAGGALNERWTAARGLSRPMGARHLRPRTAQSG